MIRKSEADRKEGLIWEAENFMYGRDRSLDNKLVFVYFKQTLTIRKL